MSKLADAIRRSQRVEAAPIGFGAARAAPKATMLVAAFVPDAGAVAAARERGADVVIIDARGANLSGPDAVSARAAAADAVLGAWLEAIGDETAADLRQAGIDFLLFDAERTPASALLDDDMGYVLALPPDPDDNFLRAAEPLALDGLYLASLPSPLTVAGQMSLNRVGFLSHKPLVCAVKADAPKSDLQALRAAGVAVVVVDGPAGGAARLKETVLALPARRQRREERPTLTLPRTTPPAEEEEEDE